MAALLMVVAFGVFFVLLFGGLVAWSAYFQPKWDGERWARAAAALGLTLEPRTSSGFFYKGPVTSQRMIGERGGVPVRVGIRYVVVGHGKNRRRIYYTYVEAMLARPLGLGLSVAPSSWLANAIGDLVGAGDLQVGHPALDAGYKISAAIPDQARQLLITPYVLEPLLALSSASFRPYLHDDVVKLEARQKCLSAEVLYGVIDNAAELSRRLASASDALGPSHVERVVGEVWRAIAEARGLTLDVERSMMAGRTEGVHVEVYAAQRGDAFTTTFLVRFDRPLGIGLRLERQAGLSKLGALIGMQDIETGDATFDKRFLVKGQPEAAVRAALSPEVRSRLVSLQEHASSLTVEDDHLRADVGWLVSEPAHVHGAIAAIAQAGAALTGAGERAVGPYRS
jgi:hypothetical protein